jgi:uncharacterized protein YbjT (DUF2867 family)
MSDKTILVIGATGAQGGSVARHLLSRGSYAVRALTRNPESAAARTLLAAGAEVVKGELDDRASLRCALKGVYGVYGVTNYWEHFDREAEHGRNLINAVAGAEVEHFVFSSLPAVSKTSGGELRVPHFDQKHELEQYAKSLGIPSTFVHVAFYYENFFSFFPPRKNGDGAYHFGFPQGNVPLAGVAAEDIGGVVATIFEYPAEFLGRTVGIVGDDLTGSEYADVMSRVSEKTVRYADVPRDVFATYPFPGADDLADMFTFNQRYIPNRGADLHESRVLHPSMQSFEQWAMNHRAAFQSLLV